MLPKATVLFVDDQADALRPIARTLEAWFNVLSASTAEEALSILGAQQVDILVADQKMPAISGVALAEAVRARKIDVRTILLTDDAEAADLVTAIDRGWVYRFLTKPWSPRDLLLTIRNALEAAQLKRDNEQLVRQLRKRIDALTMIYEVSRQSATDAPTYEAIVERGLEAGARVLRHDCGAALIAFDRSRSAILRLRCYSSVGEKVLISVKEAVLADHRKQSGFLLPEERVITRVTGTIVSEGEACEPFLSQLTVPLVADGISVGTLSLFSRERNAYTAEDGELLDALANQTTDAIQALRRAEDEARRRMELMVESMVDGVILTDEKAEVAIINPAAKQLLRLAAPREVLTSPEIQGILRFDLFELARTWDYGGPKMIRHELNLGEKFIHCTFAPVLDAWESLRGVVIVMRDVTDERRLEDRKQEFVSIISHELRTPLTSISGALDLVLNVLGGTINDKQRRYLCLAKESTDKLNAVVDDLLDLSKFAKGRLRMEFSETCLDELIRQALDTYDAAISEKRVQVQASIPAGRVPLQADGRRLTQVLNNLLTNAVKFTVDGGQIRIELRTSAQFPGYACVAVWNSGESIPETALERIFDQFEQVRGEADHRRGTGLGLAICRSIVEAHGGRIWAEPCSTGAQFVLVVPSRPSAEEEEAESSTSRSLTSALRLQILLAVEDLELGYLLKATLLKAHYQVVLTRSTPDSISSFRGHPPDLLIADAQLLRREEDQTLWATLNCDLELRKVPLLALLDPAAEEPIALARRGVIRKPLSATDLTSAVQSLTRVGGPVAPANAGRAGFSHLGFVDLRTKAIERELQKRARAGVPFAFCCLDLEDLKAYNAYYGFAKTSGLVRQTGDLLHEIILQWGAAEDFLGHVPGDDFVFITHTVAVDAICHRAIKAFDRIIPLYYDQVDYPPGTESSSAGPDLHRAPLLSASIVAVICNGSPVDHAILFQQAAEVRRRAAGIQGSYYLRSDRADPVLARRLS